LLHHLLQLALETITYITPTMILYEDMKPIEHVLLHQIYVLSHLMCACKHCNITLSLHYLNTLKLLMNLSLQKKTDFTRFFMIETRHPTPRSTNKSRSGFGWRKPAVGVGALVTCGKTPATLI